MLSVELQPRGASRFVVCDNSQIQTPSLPDSLKRVCTPHILRYVSGPDEFESLEMVDSRVFLLHRRRGCG